MTDKVDNKRNRTIRLSDEEWDKIAKAALKARLTPSEWIRSIILTHVDDKGVSSAHDMASSNALPATNELIGLSPTESRELARNVHAIWCLLQSSFIERGKGNTIEAAIADARKIYGV